MAGPLAARAVVCQGSGRAECSMPSPDPFPQRDQGLQLRRIPGIYRPSLRLEASAGCGYPGGPIQRSCVGRARQLCRASGSVAPWCCEHNGAASAGASQREPYSGGARLQLEPRVLLPGAGSRRCRADCMSRLRGRCAALLRDWQSGTASQRCGPGSRYLPGRTFRHPTSPAMPRVCGPGCALPTPLTRPAPASFSAPTGRAKWSAARPKRRTTRCCPRVSLARGRLPWRRAACVSALRAQLAWKLHARAWRTACTLARTRLDPTWCGVAAQRCSALHQPDRAYLAAPALPKGRRGHASGASRHARW